MHSISSLGLGHFQDTESDYDTDDVDSGLTNSSYLRLTELTASSSDNANKDSANVEEEENTNSEGLYDFDDATIKRQTHKKHKKCEDVMESSAIDSLQTPTNDTDLVVPSCNGDLSNGDIVKTPTNHLSLDEELKIREEICDKNTEVFVEDESTDQT